MRRQIMLPPPFLRQMQTLLGDDYPAFIAAMQEPPPVSLRRNPGKRPAAGAWSFQDALTPVPWHPEGFYLGQRPVFTLDPLFHAGAYYVQEASSMFLHEALRQTVNFSKPLRILDLCAAPGGKSTLLASMLNDHSLLVSNEVIRQRVGVLRENMEKWGIPNIAVTSAEAGEFAALDGWFDLIVADAPCSGEGLFRKDPDAVQEWSPAHIELCAGRQRRILADVLPALAPGGVLAYSTCTYNRHEDDDNVEWLRETFHLELITLDLPPDWNMVHTPAGGYQFFPHRLRGEGFFIALFRKPDGAAGRNTPPARFKNIQPLGKKQVPLLDGWLNPAFDASFFETPTGDVLALSSVLETEYRVLDGAVKNKWFGLNTGAFKGQDFIPSHALALSCQVSPTLPGLDFSREQALRFLKKEVFDLPASAPQKGWALARFGGLNLGWLKIVPNRWNNYLPQERRIRMELG